MTWRAKIRLFALVVCVLGLLLKIAIIQIATAQVTPMQPAANTASIAQSRVAAGEAIALDPGRGNCNACHQLPNSAKAKGKSKIGISLSAVRSKYPDDKKLRALIWDAQEINPQTIMPPYGKHRILSEAEIDDLVLWLMTQ